MPLEIPGLDVGWCGYSWLDKVIKEQAAYYGLTVEKHGKLQHDAAQFLEDHNEGWEQVNTLRGVTLKEKENGTS